MKSLKEKKKQIMFLLADNFISNTLGTSSPNGMCFTLSFALSLHLENNGFNNNMIAGIFNAGSPKSSAHFWLTLEMDKKNILDPTYRQFYKNKPNLYYGKKPKKYTIHQVEFNDWFNGSYDIWLAYLMNPFFLQSTKFDLKVLLSINLSAAIILNNEIDDLGLDIMQSSKHKAYFSAIDEILIKYWHSNRGLIMQLKQELPKGFDNLLAKALKNT